MRFKDCGQAWAYSQSRRLSHRMCPGQERLALLIARQV